jgi:hypothetical protein
MPKAVKERPTHATSLTTQLQNDRDPIVSDSKRAKRKRKADEAEDVHNGERIISGKMGRRILAMAREQQDEGTGDQESQEDDGLNWREKEM